MVSPGSVFLALGIVALVYRVMRIGKRHPRMPKGPPTVPLLGNAHQIPKSGLYKQFLKWAKEYGPVFSLKIGPSNVIVLCDRQAVHKLLRLDENHFKVQEAEATVLMTNLLQKPENFYNEIRRYTASVVTSITFGYRAPTFESFWGHWTTCMEPGANPPVDDFPVLGYIPAGLAFWKRRAMNAGRTMDAVWSEARSRAEARRATGERRNCIIDHLLDDYEKKGWPATISQHAFNNLLGETVEGGADTTAAQLLTLILAFALYPEVQERARREIDATCGPERSPRWDDFEALPYINCIIKEGMRWRPVAVTALPHRARQDDEYEGMFIPKDTTVFIPTWALHHDQDIFEDPERFHPERYLSHPKLANDYAGSPEWAKRDHYNYGAGRRICPGIHLAERNMWRIAAKLLWAFEFSEPVDPTTGKVQHLDPDAYNPGILQAPLPYKVQIKVRSQAHADTIKREHEAALEFMKQYE
ncbi:cytochrome P450 [Coniochaeta ligniaria NRRL 30616]|uniref:Cytochrome P450 n=1 Tax=Coniochaeta ligniaria NRRL 30616 TaxID=1408157 RepID=A0A1J7IYI9_9PEZI|nr:cytochrome P450 [Coniochaeta ligniaria NRRL 30616]